MMTGRKQLLVYDCEDERPWLVFDHVRSTSIHANGVDVYVEGVGSYVSPRTGRPWRDDPDEILCVLMSKHILVTW